MAIIGQNSLLNQYTPTFYIRDILDGQSLIYDSTRKAFVNSAITGGSGASKLGELLNVSPNVDSPSISLHTGQALVYNSFTSLWENSYVDYDTLLNKPDFTGTVASVSVVTANGISGTVANPTTTPAITLALGAITPTSVAAAGTVTGSNLTGSMHGTFSGTSSGSNTGDQTITLTGDVTGSGTGSFVTTLGTVPISKGGTGQTTANAAFNALAPSQSGNIGRYLRTDGTSTYWAVGTGAGTVSDVSAEGSQGVTTSVINGTTTPHIIIGLGDITPTAVASTGTVTGSNLSGIHTGTSSGLNTGDQTITLTDDVTGSGTGTFSATLSATGVVANTYGSSTTVPVFAVDSKGRISSVVNTPISSASSGAAEIVVFRYSGGSAGNFSDPGAIISETSGVSATIISPSTCVVEYSFTGYARPPKSIMIYGQNYAANTFSLTTVGSVAGTSIMTGGGTSATPALISGFSASNVLTLQTTMASTGTSAGLGQRPYLIVVFGF